ncbi:hypothetical protein BYT27DRAFT_7294045 [Phlegmacium glaucopus]|nr:hypothetical protein BYT27DRAFT_7294045 [Phlegmacium glaucopus]
MTHIPPCLISGCIFIYNHHGDAIMRVEVILLSRLQSFQWGKSQSDKFPGWIIEENVQCNWEGLSTTSTSRDNPIHASETSSFKVLPEQVSNHSHYPPPPLLNSAVPVGESRILSTLLILRLVTSLAVHHALLYAVLGEMKEPAGQGGGFSQENWGDIIVAETMPNGKQGKKIVKWGSIYKEQLDNHPEKHWELILEMASTYVGKKKAVGQSN